MGKPSEKNFYSRLNALAGTDKKSNINENNGNGTLIDFQKSSEGTNYGIVKENHRYFIKKSNSQNSQLDSSDFAYIGGLENKHLYEYHSLSEAEKQRNIYIKSLNEAFSLRPVEILKEEKVEEKVDNPFEFLRSKINEGKAGNKKKFEKQFKSTLTENIETSVEKRGLMPEAADIAVKKALGLLKEEDIVTADSEVKDGDILPDKKGKENPQAPINDSNAKAEAEKAMGKDSIPKKKGDPKSLAVNQADANLKEEASPLVTDDSELNAGASLANDVNKKHEKPQAPINDGNAKAIADKALAKGSASDPIVNNAEESTESDPLEDKEDDGPKADAISVNEDDQKSDPFEDNPTDKGAMSTEDSDQKDADQVDNKTGHEAPQAPYNSYNQPDKGQKEEKGTKLEPKASKKDIVAEEKALSTADSEIKTGDSLVNKTSDPAKGSGKSEIVADSELNPNDSLANKTKTNLPNPVAEAMKALDALTESEASLIVADSELNPEDTLANDTTTNLPNPVAEAVGEDGEDIDNELDQAADALDSMEVEAPPVEEPVGDPMAGGEELPPEGGEMPTADDPLAGGEEMGVDPMADPMAGGEEDPMAGMEDEISGEAGGESSEEAEREAQSKLGEFGEIVRDLELSDEKIVQFANQAIEPLDTEKLSHNDKLKIQNKLEGDEGAGEDLPPESEEPAEEPAPVDDIPEIPAGAGEEEVTEGGEMCAECGPFDGYAQSRGYEDVGSAGGMELANLLSGYAGAHGEGMNDGDFGKVVILLTPEVRDEMMGYGHEDFLGKADAFAAENPADDEPADEEKLSPGSFDIEVPEAPEEEFGAEDDENVEADVEDSPDEVDDTPNVDDETAEGGNEEVDEGEKIDEFGWRDIKNVGAGIAGVGQKAGQKVADKAAQAQQAVAGAMQKGVDYVGDKAKGVKQTYHKGAANRIVNDINQDATKLGQTIAKFNTQAQKGGQEPISAQKIVMSMMNAIKQGGETGYQKRFEGEESEQPVMEFAPPAQSLGVVGGVSESEQKVRDYVKARLEEKAGKRKPMMNESEKPAALKKLDKMIDEQWNVYGREVKNKIK